jgi:hypothetical protein
LLSGCRLEPVGPPLKLTADELSDRFQHMRSLSPGLFSASTLVQQAAWHDDMAALDYSERAGTSVVWHTTCALALDPALRQNSGAEELFCRKSKKAESTGAQLGKARNYGRLSRSARSLFRPLACLFRFKSANEINSTAIPSNSAAIRAG